MADRNPYIPSERRQDVENREQNDEELAHRRFAEEQAKLEEKTRKLAAQQAEADRERQDKPEEEK